jgi:hypothetical protein
MPLRLGLVLSQHNVRRLRRPEPDVALVLLERTLLDPPRAAAARRWGAWLRRFFPNAELVPYAWHLVTHPPEEGLRARSTRTLEGPPHAFGLLQPTREVEQAWDATRQTALALGAERVALRTPTGLSPGPVGRQRLAAFVAKHGGESALIWEPHGLWTPAQVELLAEELGLTPILDAFDEPGPRAWLRVEPMLRTTRLDPDQTDDLLELIDARDEPVVLFAGSAALANLHTLLRSAG